MVDDDKQNRTGGVPENEGQPADGGRTGASMPVPQVSIRTGEADADNADTPVAVAEADDAEALLGLHSVADLKPADETDESKAITTTTGAVGKDVQADDGLTPEQRQANTIRFLERMEPDVHKKLMDAAAPTLELFLNDENRINHYGDKVVAKVNDLVDKQLEHINKRANYPEINKMIRDMTGEFGDSIEEYEKNNSFDVIDKTESSFKRWLRQRMETMKRNRFDAKSMIERFDYIESKLNEKNSELAYNISWGQQLITANNQAIDNLIRITAAIEAIRDLAARKADALASQLQDTDMGDPNWHNLDDERTALAVVIHDLDIKHSEYVTKLFDAHSSNAQVRNIIAISQGIRQKSNSVVTSTIPNMKRVIAQIAMTMDAREQAEFINNSQHADEIARAYLNHTATENNKFVMQVSESPVLTPETIRSTAEAIVQQNREFIESIEEGAKRRAAVEQEVLTGVNLIDQSIRERNTHVIDALIDEAASASHDGSAKQIGK